MGLKLGLSNGGKICKLGEFEYRVVRVVFELRKKK